MVAAGVLAPGGACIYVLAGGGCVVEAEGVGDNRGRGLEDELAQGGDAGGAQGQAESAELGCGIAAGLGLFRVGPGLRLACAGAVSPGQGSTPGRKVSLSPIGLEVLSAIG